MENAVRKLGTPVCSCGCGMLMDLKTLDYYCPCCKKQLTRAEMKKLEEAFEDDAQQFM